VSDFTKVQASAYFDKKNFHGRLNQEIGIIDEFYPHMKQDIFA
jgi:hypothetical protein